MTEEYTSVHININKRTAGTYLHMTGNKPPLSPHSHRHFNDIIHVSELVPGAVVKLTGYLTYGDELGDTMR